MKLKELENQLETLKNNVAELENKIAEIKGNEDRNNKFPDVKDIPQIYDFDDYKKTAECWSRVWIVNSWGEVFHTEMYKENIKSSMVFPTEELAEMFREKAQLIADCIFFKWMYDRNYVPDFSLSGNYVNMYAVAYDPEAKLYQWCTESYIDYNQIYFSSEEIAEKCAEWLNYKYFGICNLKEDKNNA